MKKLLLTSLLLATSLLSFAQTPAVPNGGFENWSTGDCGDKPTDYITYSELLKAAAGNCASPTGITKSTNKYSGTYALELKTAVYTVTAGSMSIPVNSSNSATLYAAFDARPTKLIGYTKFTKGGTDNLTISIELIDDNDDLVADGELILSSTQSGYTKFEITLDYKTSNTNDVSALNIDLSIGDANDMASSSTVALIDALSFEYGTTTSTVNYSTTSPVNVFAANKTINFSENVSDVHVVDMIGANKMQETAATKALNAASLTTGIYIVTYKYNDAYFSKKIIVE
jgi:hypothetical protein